MKTPGRAAPKLSLIAETRRLLRQHRLRAKKGLAQHYLVDENALATILSAASLSQSDVVIEVGPGLGVLTRELAARARRVIAIEFDEGLARVLKETLASRNVTVINEDILRVDPAVLLDEFQGIRYKVVANLPYYITAPVLRHFLEARVRPDTMVLMVQKEVAETIAARPGEMSILAVSVQFYGKPEIVGYVPAASFYPPPKVDSAILKISVYPEPPLPVTDREGFFRMVRAGFCAARKQIINSLAQGLGMPKPEVAAFLEGAGISGQRRAETLSLEEWARLWQEFERRHA